MIVNLTKASLGVLAVLLAQGFFISERVHATENQVPSSDETVGVQTSDQHVTFQDSNLDSAVRSQLGVTHNQNLSRSEVSRLTTLTANKRSIANLTGLEQATNLTILKLNRNSINDISSLSSLTSLTELRLNRNSINDISSISGLTLLRKLHLKGNRISDISVLATLASSGALGRGDVVDLRDNPLNGAAYNTHIPSLRSSGVRVRFSPRPTVTLSTDALDVAEAGGIGTYTVVLGNEPEGDVTVTPVSGDETVATVSDPLTFTTINWQTPQQVTVTGVNDLVDNDPNRTVSISHTVAGGGYAHAAVGDMTVTATDNDSAGVQATTPRETSFEEGESWAYTLTLTSQPTADVRLQLSGNSGLEALPTELTFTSQNWNQPQTVTVTGDDDIDNPVDPRSGLITHVSSSTDATYDEHQTNVSVQIRDNDTVGITVSGSELSVGEAGGTTTYTVVLDTEPTGEVTVTPSSSDDTVATVSGALTFTARDWQTPKQVMVTGVDDSIDNTNDRTANISHTVVGGGYDRAASVSLRVIATDNDSPGVELRTGTLPNLAHGSFEVQEAARRMNYTVALSSQPSADVTVTPSVFVPNVVGATVSPTSMTFTSANWNQPQTVTLTWQQAGSRINSPSPQKQILVGHGTASDDNAYNIHRNSAILPLYLLNTRPIVTVPNRLLVPEAGGTVNYMVVLSGQPTANVTVTPSSSDGTVATVPNTPLIFTPTNWQTPKQVTVTGVDDRIDNAPNRRATISHRIEGGGSDRAGLVSLKVIATDDDSAGVELNTGTLPTLSDGSFQFQEADGRMSYTVVLSSQPTANVTVTPSLFSTIAASVRRVTASPSRMTFTPANWNQPQTVTLTWPDDEIDGRINGNNSQQFIVRHGTASDDDLYNTGRNRAIFSMYILENDTAGVTLSRVPSSIFEGEHLTYTIALDTKPTHDVWVEITSGDRNAARVSPGELRFTSSNWRDEKTVTVRGVNDNIVNQDERTLLVTNRVESTDGKYHEIDLPFSIAVVDRGTPTVAIARPVGESGPVSSDFNITITFNQSVTGFNVDDLSVGNGTVKAGSFSGSGASYTATITPTANYKGPVTVDIAADAATNGANQGSMVAAQLSVMADQTVPTVAIARPLDESGPVNGNFNVTITFSKPVTGFKVGDLTVGNGTASNFSGSGASYTATITPTADHNGPVTVDIEANAATDGASRGNTAAAQFSATADQTVPTVAIARPVDESGPVNGPFDVTITFSEAMTGFEARNLRVGNGRARNLVGSGNTYTATITPNSYGPVTVNIPAGVALDLAGNSNLAAAEELSVMAELFLGPRPRITPILYSLTNRLATGRFAFEVNFNPDFFTLSPVTDFSASSLILNNGKDVQTFSALPEVGKFIFTVAPITDGPVRIDVPAGAARDARGNYSKAATLTVMADVAPTVAIARSEGESGLVKGDFNITITFSQSVTGFNVNDLRVGNGRVKAGSFSGSGASYTATITPTANHNGPVTVDIAASAAMDTSSNGNEAAPQFSVTADQTAPTVAIARPEGESGPVSSDFNITITFSESVTGFGVDDLSVGNGTVKAGSFSGSGASYTATITPTANYKGPVTVDIAVDAATNGANQGNMAAAQFSVMADQTVPTVAIARPEGESGPVNGNFNVTITFSKPVTGFEVGDLTVVNGTASNFSGSGASYTATITPTADHNGPVMVDIEVNAATDGASRGNTAAAQFSVTADQTAPTVAIARPVDESGSVNGNFNITITFSEAVTDFGVGKLRVGNGTASNLVGSENTYTATITPTSYGSVTVNIPAGAALDLAGNSNLAAAQELSVMAELFLGPRARIVSPPVATKPFSFQVSFNEQVTDFSASKLILNNAKNIVTFGFYPQMGMFLFTVTPITDGPVTIDVPAGAARDARGNYTQAAQRVTVMADVAPTVVIARPEGESGLVNGEFNITITFSQSVTGFGVDDLNVGNGTVKAGSFSGSGASYTATITPTANHNGPVTVDIAANRAMDTSGDGNEVAPQFSVTADLTAPTVAIAQPVGESGPVNGEFNITITFNESVTGFGVDDLRVGNGTVKTDSFSGSGASYTATITPTANYNGTVTVDIAADAVTDVANRGNMAAAQFSVTADQTAPTVAIARSGSETGLVTDPFNISITFSESVSGFEVSNLAVDNGTAGSFSGSGTTYTAMITPSGDGQVTVDIAADAAMDAAGNGNEAAPQFSVTADIRHLMLSATRLGVDEGRTQTYNIKLDGAPTSGDITVRARSGDRNVALVSTSGSTTPAIEKQLTFNASNWMSGLDVTVHGDDNTRNDHPDRTTTITHSISGGYAGVPVDGVEVTVKDNERGIILSGVEMTRIGNHNLSTLRINHQGAAAYAVRLDTPPPDGETVRIRIREPQGRFFRVHPESLTFTDSNWSDEQTVVIRTATTVWHDVFSPLHLRIAHTAEGGSYQAKSLFMMVNSDAATPGLVMSTANLTIPELPGGRQTRSYTVRLSTQPTGDVTVNIGRAGTGRQGSSDSGLVTVRRQPPAHGSTITQIPYTPLTFTQNNWYIPQTVHVQGPASNGQTNADRTDNIQHIASGANYGNVTLDLGVTIVNKPTVAIARPVGESGPVSGDFNITITFSKAVTGFGVDDLTVGNGTASNFSGGGASYTATITPTTDHNGPVTVDIAANAATNGARLGNRAAAQFSVTADQTAPTVAIARLVGESGPVNGDFNITITFSESVTGFDLDDLNVGSGTAGNFSGSGANYTATITPNVDGQVTVDIAANAAMDAAGNDNTAAPQFSVMADLTPPTVSLSTTALSVNEAGGSTTYTIVLTEQPTSNVVVEPTMGAAGVVTVLPTQLTFTIENWSEAQTVTVTGVDDDVINESARSVTISHEIEGGGYDEVAVDPVTVTAIDNETSGVVVSPTILRVNEGSNTRYTIALTKQPTGNVQVTPTSNAHGAATVSGPLTFTTSNWNQAQEVIVTGVNDNTINDPARSATISHTMTGGGYDEVEVADVTVTVKDAAGAPTSPRVARSRIALQTQGTEVTAISIRAVEPSVTEGEALAFELTATPAPAVDVVVGITVGDPDSVLVDRAPTEVTIPANQSTALIELETDDDEVDELDATVTITLQAATNADYTIAAAPDNSASVTVIDNDGLTQERREEGIEHALGAFGRAAGWDLAETIRERSRNTAQAGKAFEIVNLPSSTDRLRPMSMDFSDLLERDTEIRLTFNPQVAQTSESESSDKSPLVRAWIKASRTDIESDPFEGRTQEGEMVIGRFGLDVAHGSGWVLGSVFSWHDANIEFDDNSFATKGEVDLDTLSVNPYVSFRKDRLHLWGTIGGGIGELSYEDSPTGQATSTSSDLRMLTAAAGAEYEFGRLGPFDLKGRGEGMIVNIGADDSSHSLVGYDDIGVTVYGARGEFELGLPVSLDGKGTKFRPYVFTGLRQDGGLGNDLAIEYGGGFDIRTGSLLAAGSVRSQFGRDDDAVELKGYSISLTYDRGNDRKGVVAKLEQSTGPSDYDPYGISALSSLGSSVAGTATRLHLGYGIGWDEKLLRPFVAMDWRESQESDLDLGLEYQYSGGRASLIYTNGETSNLGFRFEKLF